MMSGRKSLAFPGTHQLIAQKIKVAVARCCVRHTRRTITAVLCGGG
jgi:hypothetical protein